MVTFMVSFGVKRMRVKKENRKMLEQNECAYTWPTLHEYILESCGTDGCRKFGWYLVSYFF